MKAKVWLPVFVFTLSLASKVSAQTLVYCAGTSPVHPSPVLASDSTSIDLGKHIYDTLLETDPSGSKAMPTVAESYTLSKDLKTYRFVLKPNVKFHSSAIFKPTRPLNADDAVFSLERLYKKDHPLHKVGGAYPIFSSMKLESAIDSVKKVDERTVEIRLKAPYAAFPGLLAHKGIASIYSKEYAEAMIKAGTPQLVDQKPIGSGPFVFRSYDVNSRVILDSNQEYFRGPSPLKKLVFEIVTESSVRAQKLFAKECHVAFQPDPRDLQAIRTRPGTTVAETSGMNLSYVAMNVEKPPFNDPRVRKAILHAMNRKSYVQALHGDTGELADAPVPSTIWGHESLFASDHFDREKAAALVKQVSPNGRIKARLWALPVTRIYMPNGKKLAEMMQSDLASVGIDADIETFDWGTYLAKSDAGQHEILQIGWTSTLNDPDFFFSPLLTCDAIPGGGNLSRWCNEKFDGLVNRARVLGSEKERAALYKQAMKIFSEEAPFVPISSGRAIYGVRSDVVGFKPFADGSHNFYGVSIKQ